MMLNREMEDSIAAIRTNRLDLPQLTVHSLSTIGYLYVMWIWFDVCIIFLHLSHARLKFVLNCVTED